MARYEYLLLAAVFGYIVLSASGELQIACEGRSAVLRCPNGYSINVIHANYGRGLPGDTVCTNPNIHTTNCYSADSRQIATQRCNGNQICSISASNAVFGDPCVGTHKYFEVVYLCV